MTVKLPVPILSSRPLNVMSALSVTKLEAPPNNTLCCVRFPNSIPASTLDTVVPSTVKVP